MSFTKCAINPNIPFTERSHSSETERYVEFIVYDWRHQKITQMSCEPSASTCFDNASSNSLPYDLSAAYFRPEVLSKYREDVENYCICVKNRTISFRDEWVLRPF